MHRCAHAAGMWRSVRCPASAASVSAHGAALLDLRPAVQQVLLPCVPRSASHESSAVLYLRPRARVHHLKWELTKGNVVLVTLPLYERTPQSDEWFVGRTSMRACVD